jgi:cellulose synthase/poly-beta-1,6-N-acetylglucosamine synthase-like glycosyltransferase
MIWIAFFVFLFCAFHPFTTYPMTLILAGWLAKTRRQAPTPTSAPPTSFALLCCAYNEEKIIGDKLKNCAALMRRHPTLQVLFYTDGCSDRTAEMIAEYPQITLVKGETRIGKSHGMSNLAERVVADVMIFTDANVMIDEGAIDALSKALAPADVGCVCGHLIYVNGTESMTASVGAHYWSFDEWLKGLETRTGSCMGADGSLFAIRRELFIPTPRDIIDDFFTSLSIWCAGRRIVIATDAIAYERSTVRPGEEFRRKIRIACRAFNCHRMLWPLILRLPYWEIYKYVSHKLLRWGCGFFLVASYLSMLVGLALASGPLAIGFAALTLAILAGMFTVGWWPIAILREFLLATSATSIGMLYSMRGHRFQTWDQSGTTRTALTG